MGCIIYTNGELNTSEMSEEQISFIESIKDAWGYQVFAVKDNCIRLRQDEIEGSDPLADGVEGPLTKLLEYANEQEISINGDISIKSDWNDYDNILIGIVDNEISYANAEIRYASNDELIRELERRGLIKDGVLCLEQEKDMEER